MNIKPKHSLTSVADSIADGFQEGKILPTSAVDNYIVKVIRFIESKPSTILTLDKALSKSETRLSLHEKVLIKEITELTNQMLEIIRRTKSLNLSQRRTIRKLSVFIDDKLVNLWYIWCEIYK